VLFKGTVCLFVQLNDIDKDHWLFTDFLHHVMHRLYNLNTAISSKYRGDLFLLAEGQSIIFFSVMFVVLRPSRLLQRKRNDYDISCRGLHVKSHHPQPLQFHDRFASNGSANTTTLSYHSIRRTA